MRILTMTTLYPNAAAPHHGVFVENRLAAFRARTGAQMRVVAPVPWFPFKGAWAGRYALYARAPKHESRRGFEILHPRYAVPPKIGMTYAVTALERVFLKAARAEIAAGREFDLIDAHYLYPDGVAAARVAHRLGKPLVLTARGTDVNLIPKYRRQRAMIVDAVKKADAVICVAAALRKELIRIGAPADKIVVLRNGVDLDMFRPLDRVKIRREMNLYGDVVASVGHLTDRKGHEFVLEALAELKDATLLIAGSGENREALEAQALRLGLQDKVRFLGAVPHEKLAEIYNAADVLALASDREGWPNVLLEAMACGTPAVATPVWGNGEVIRAPEAGALAEARSAPAIATALKKILADRPERAATRAYAEKFSWDDTSDGLERIFSAAVARDKTVKSTAIRSIEVAARKPQLLVTIDTEEAFDWSKFRNVTFTVCPPQDIARFHDLARGFGAAPLYFITHPVIEDPASADYFRGLLENGEAALGLHLHQWATPPREGFQGEFYSYQCNLSDAAHRAKLGALASAYEKSFGVRARSHRAGRYGISLADYAALAATGVEFDFSPSPCFDFTRRGGPDFSTASNRPFRVAPNGAKEIAVTPVSGGLAIKGGGIFLSRKDTGAGLERAAPRRTSPLLAPQRLTCEGSDLKDVIALTKRLVDDGAPVLTFSLHSTTMTPGGNIYSKTARDVDRALEFCKDYFAFFKNELGGEFLSFDGLARLYAESA